MTILWIGAIVVFGVVEAVTAGLVSILFVPGAVAALIAALAATRPLVRKLSAGRAVPTNADRVLGEQGKVTETIDNENSTGTVYVDGKIWTARSADGTRIQAGSQVEIQRMEGVKLFVRELSSQESGAEREMEKEEA